jgi:hypothetical protein
MPDQSKMVKDRPGADKPALSKLVESMPAQDKLAEDMPAQGKLVEDKLVEDTPAQDELEVDKDLLVENKQGKLYQMEADSPALIVIAYVCIMGKLGNGGGLHIGMHSLRGVFATMEGLV